MPSWRWVVAMMVMAGAWAWRAEAALLEVWPRAQAYLWDDAQQAWVAQAAPPLAMPQQYEALRYYFVREGFAPEALLVLMPMQARAPLTLRLENRPSPLGAKAEGLYFDRLLRAHRLLLKGQLDAAEAVIAALEADDGASFGTMVLRGNVYAARGKVDEALAAFTAASRLLPDNADVKTLIDDLVKTRGKP